MSRIGGRIAEESPLRASTSHASSMPHIHRMHEDVSGTRLGHKSLHYAVREMYIHQSHLAAGIGRLVDMMDDRVERSYRSDSYVLLALSHNNPNILSSLKTTQPHLSPAPPSLPTP